MPGNYKKAVLKSVILLIILLPSFTNIFMKSYDIIHLPGIYEGQLIYLGLILIFVPLIIGSKVFSYGIAAASIISISVVFMGGLVSYIKIIIGLSDSSSIFEYSPHYIRILINMFTVIPLTLSIILTIPFKDYEHRLFRRMRGASFLEKSILISSRVFTHILFSVIPNMLMVNREEEYYRKKIAKDHITDDFIETEIKKIKRRLVNKFAYLIHFAVAGICSSIELLPLWSVEISQIPNRKQLK